jgi:hypothetical protein
MQDTKTFTGVLTPYDATYYLMIRSKEFCELYREIEPTGIVLSITPYEVIDEDFEDCLGPVRAHRYEYLVEVRRGKRCDEEYFEKLTPLVEYVLSNAPELTPTVYYHLLAAYLEAASGAYRTRSLALLGLGQVACTPLEARLAESEWFPEDELAYREAFYSVCFINGAQYDLLLLPKRQEVTALVLGRSLDELCGANSAQDALMDVGLFRRWAVDLQSPPWSDKSYATLLRRWAQCIDTLIEAPCDRAVLEMFRCALLLGEGDERDE